MKNTRQAPADIKDPIAWREGYDACRRGSPVTACRYASNSPEALAWLSGYFEAKEPKRQATHRSRR
ncbi:ribosome modulation factor [Cupriavidus consociatus]|uniref:ribosome modulation factor n=1 Tax=Cupriavidus consociatus TaxID=2821357 RepID=UPI003D760E2A